jgi:hypothetical protein
VADLVDTSMIHFRCMPIRQMRFQITRSATTRTRLHTEDEESKHGRPDSWLHVSHEELCYRAPTPATMNGRSRHWCRASWCLRSRVNARECPAGRRSAGVPCPNRWRHDGRPEPAAAGRDQLDRESRAGESHRTRKPLGRHVQALPSQTEPAQGDRVASCEPHRLRATLPRAGHRVVQFKPEKSAGFGRAARNAPTTR